MDIVSTSVFWPVWLSHHPEPHSSALFACRLLITFQFVTYGLISFSVLLLLFFQRVFPKREGRVLLDLQLLCRSSLQYS